MSPGKSDEYEKDESSKLVSHHGRQQVCCCTPVCKIILIAIALLFQGCGIFSYMGVSRYYHRTSCLAIASDVIECAKYSPLYEYSKTVVNETPSDPINDNRKGLVMDLFTLKETDITYHRYLDYRTKFELVLPTTGVNKFLMPFEYYNRPWYLWKDSTINIDFQIVHKQKLTTAMLYLIKSDANVNSFFAKKKLPKYERQMDMLSLEGSNSVQWSVKHNDYYYIAVYAEGSKDIVFKANITFNFTYIDVDDYPWIKDTAQRASGVNQPLTLRPLPSGSTNRTLCYLHSLPDNSLDSDSIHITTDYYIDDILRALLIGVPGAFLFYIVLVVGVYSLCTSRKFRSVLDKFRCIINEKKEKNGYILIN